MPGCRAEADKGKKYLKNVEEVVEMPKRAFVLINVGSGKAKYLSVSMARREVLPAISKIYGVILAQAVTGPYEIIAVVEAEGLTEIGDIVTSKIAKIPSIDRWTVCVGIEQAVDCQDSNLLPARSNG
jgi:DNA-binding Lrp family transcriptional regulator